MSSLKKYLKNHSPLVGGIFCLFWFCAGMIDVHCAPFVFTPSKPFKPIVFKPETFHFQPVKPAFNSPFKDHPINPVLKEAIHESPKQDAKECEQCLGSILQIFDREDFLTQAQCYECITSACGDASTIIGNEKYTQCKTILGPPIY